MLSLRPPPVRRTASVQIKGTSGSKAGKSKNNTSKGSDGEKNTTNHNISIAIGLIYTFYINADSIMNRYANDRGVSPL